MLTHLVASIRWERRLSGSKLCLCPWKRTRKMPEAITWSAFTLPYQELPPALD